MAERIERVDEEQEKLERRRSGSRKPNMDQHEGLVVWASPGNPRIPTASRARLIPPNNAIVTGPRFGVGDKRRCHDAVVFGTWVVLQSKDSEVDAEDGGGLGTRGKLDLYRLIYSSYACVLFG